MRLPLGLRRLIDQNWFCGDRGEGMLLSCVAFGPLLVGHDDLDLDLCLELG